VHFWGLIIFAFCIFGVFLFLESDPAIPAIYENKILKTGPELLNIELDLSISERKRSQVLQSSSDGDQAFLIVVIGG